jgi:cytochrome oxidase Cu insertion factor (SCO1/SenC/PrrC family)
MFKGSLSKLNNILKNNNIEVKDIGLYKELKLKQNTYMISNSSRFYIIDNEGFRTEEQNIKPSLLLEILGDAIQVHLNLV